ncbi:DMT family transporter [Neptunomonas sp. XY-337]|uniref:DMT family transporter n=1 Tax=Neptunomonas sp. XY-337 TaxID=2561897 RepID=UPI0010AA7CF6|nr:DMT family transporter [Neptunomonas sp. XY-337]
MDERKALLFALGAVLLWSTVATAFKITLTYFTPIKMLFLASGFSIVALAAVAGIQGKLTQAGDVFRSRPLFFVSMGLINPLAYYLVLFAAYDLLPASQAQPLNYSWAITLTLMAAFFLGHPIRRYDIWAILFGYLGVVVIATKGDILGLQFDSPLGVGLALFSTILWSSYWILNAKNSADPVLSVLLGFIVSLPLSGAMSLWEGAWQPVPWQGWFAVGYVGFFEMGITFVLWLTALKSTENTARISNLIFISPFISLLLLATIIGEEIHLATIVGLVLIVVGLLIQQMKRQPN